MSRLDDERELLSKPGDVIIEMLEHLKMSQVELAQRTGKTASKVNDLITGKEPITVQTALQLEKVLGIDAQFWLNRETLYREKLARIEQEEALEECLDWLKDQPLPILKKHGYLKTEKVGIQMAEECLKFYGVSSPTQWESVYVDRYVSSDFRKSSIHHTMLTSLAAWLRIGEIEMQKLKLPEYNKDSFKNALLEIRNLVRHQPEDFAERLKRSCLESGVAIVYTINVPKAPVSGVARWMGGNPLIQLTDRGKTNDKFWFTFFHEAGHILLHGKKEVFIEDFELYDADKEKEDQANEFARATLLPANIESELPEKITEKEIRLLARKYDTHPAIVLGQLQKLKKVPYSFGNSLKLKIVLDYVIAKH
ncbi:MAG: HigA family addiction module antidote protein [Bacteroidetes bacterium]|nr:HigA family addiction module antidote protein [Bacteroidota bacterium]